MPKVKVVIEIESNVWDAVPDLARTLELTSDAQTPETASRLFEYLVQQAMFELALPQPGVRTNAAGQPFDPTAALSALLDPNVALPIAIALAPIRPAPDGKTLLDMFDDLATLDPHDPWIISVKAKSDDLALWKAALAATYVAVKGAERRSVETWSLIEKTFRFLKNPVVDKSSLLGEYGGVPSGTQTNPQPKKE